MFIIDASGSIGDDAFEDARKFIEKVVDGFDISNHKTRVGVIEYSSDVRAFFSPMYLAAQVWTKMEGQRLRTHARKLAQKNDILEIKIDNRKCGTVVAYRRTIGTEYVTGR